MAEIPITTRGCTGRGTADGDHCCYLEGETCAFLVDNGSDENPRFRCGLYLELGSWDAVHSDPRYQPIGEHFLKVGAGLCGDWQPKKGECCLEPR